ncbi:hypothetical protein GCM10022419_043000 [Nonomuraea rosea]|uniref:Uncharacterized protein n=1 Tax=Nonomuraea rosea TaxID=638574 RepID=A0ABP6WX53_9ACTN
MQQAEALVEEVAGDEAAEALDHEQNAEKCHGSIVSAGAARVIEPKYPATYTLEPVLSSIFGGRLTFLSAFTRWHVF